MALGQSIGFFDVGTDCPDLEIKDGGLRFDPGLVTAVMISLFTDRFANEEERPPTESDPRGWWGDVFSEPITDQIGSRIWTIERSKINEETAASLEEFSKEALDWMIEDGISDNIIATAVIVSGDRINLAIQIFRPDGVTTFRFIWDGQALRAAEEA